MIFDTKHGGLTGLKQKCIKMSEANARKVSVDVACLKWVEAPLEFFFFFFLCFLIKVGPIYLLSKPHKIMIQISQFLAILAFWCPFGGPIIR